MQKTDKNQYDVIIVGGGASGFFTAINIAISRPDLKIAILEQSSRVLEKVKISGGGRCNVTTSVLEPKELIKNYPRGGRELLNAFYSFGPRQVIEWFESHQVELKTEEDGRMFPVTNSSLTIINCFLNLCLDLQVSILTNQKVVGLTVENDSYQVKTLTDEFSCDKLVLACSTSKMIFDELRKLDISIIPTYPSLFSFVTKNTLFRDLSGISLPDCTATIAKTKIRTHGPILITHKGITGPCVLKLSAFGAKEFLDLNYHAEIKISWLNWSQNEVQERLVAFKTEVAKKNVNTVNPFTFPQRFWQNMLHVSQVDLNKNWADISKKEMNVLVNNLTNFSLLVTGKNTNKDEFVTAGGVDFKEVDSKTMESKKYPNLYFTGELLNVDGITGGFNFQAAWTTAMMVARNISGVNH